MSLDLDVKRAQEALRRLGKRQSVLESLEEAQEETGKKLLQNSKLQREDWRDYGKALLSLRKKKASNKEFGQLVAENGLDKSPASSPTIRTDAIWLAEKWRNVEPYFAPGSEIEMLHSPARIHQACRDEGEEWAFGKEKKDGGKKLSSGRRRDEEKEPEEAEEENWTPKERREIKAKQAEVKKENDRVFSVTMACDEIIRVRDEFDLSPQEWVDQVPEQLRSALRKCKLVEAADWLSEVARIVKGVRVQLRRVK